MCLAAACGVWDDGLGAEPAVDPARVVMCGVRDLDAGERALVDLRGVKNEPPSNLAQRLAGLPVYVHLDLDVLDPSVMAAQFAVPGGLSDGGLRTLLAEVAESAEVVGVEITAFEAPDDETETAGLAELMASIVEPLLEVAAMTSPPARRSSTTSTSAARRSGSAAGPRRSTSSTPPRSSPRASASTCSSTRARSPSSACTASRTSRRSRWPAATRPPTA